MIGGNNMIRGRTHASSYGSDGIQISNPFLIVNLALKAFDFSQNLALRDLEFVFDLIDKLIESLFKAACRFECENALFDFCDRFASINGAPVRIPRQSPRSERVAAAPTIARRVCELEKTNSLEARFTKLEAKRD
jgi:hypothetical protein